MRGRWVGGYELQLIIAIDNEFGVDEMVEM